jgi:site-specific recombinase XerD
LRISINPILDDAIHQFIEHIRVNKHQSENTANGYSQGIAAFAKHIQSHNGGQHKSWKSVDQSVADDYLATLIDKGKSQRTINLTITSLRMFFDYLVVRCEADDNPFYSLNFLKAPPKKSSVLDKQAIDRLVQAPRCLWQETLEGTAPKSHIAPDFGEYKAARDETIIRLMYFAGLKTGEVVRLRDEHFDPMLSLLSVFSSRGAQRSIFLIQNVANAVRKTVRLKKALLFSTPSIIANKQGQPLTARSIERLVKDYAVHAGVSMDISPRDLRDAFEQRLIDVDVDSSMIQYLLGYEDASTAIISVARMKVALGRLENI